MKNAMLMAIILISSLSNCSSEEEDDLTGTSEYLVFGVYHNFCIGDCWHLYKIENGELYADNFDHIKDGEIKFQSVPLDKSLYSEALTLVPIPADVTASETETYGCPDCADQGGYYLEFIQEGTKRIVYFDTRYMDFENKEIVAYLDQMKAVLEILVQ